MTNQGKKRDEKGGEEEVKVERKMKSGRKQGEGVDEEKATVKTDTMTRNAHKHDNRRVQKESECLALPPLRYPDLVHEDTQTFKTLKLARQCPAQTP